MFAASIQGEEVLQVSKQPRYNAGLIPHGRNYLWAWVLCARPHFPLAFPSGSWATFPMPCKTVSYRIELKYNLKIFFCDHEYHKKYYRTYVSWSQKKILWCDKLLYR